MKTLGEITDQAMEGVMPTHEECYYGMLAYRILSILDHRNFLKILIEAIERHLDIKKLMAKDSYKRYSAALDKPPKEWLGENNDPMTDVFKQGYEVSK